MREKRIELGSGTYTMEEVIITLVSMGDVINFSFDEGDEYYILEAECKYEVTIAPVMWLFNYSNVQWRDVNNPANKSLERGSNFWRDWKFPETKIETYFFKKEIKK